MNGFGYIQKSETEPAKCQCQARSGCNLHDLERSGYEARLAVINYNSNKDINPACLRNIDEIINCGNKNSIDCLVACKECKCQRKDGTSHIHYFISYLTSRIPVFLVNKDTMDRYKNSWEEELSPEEEVEEEDNENEQAKSKFPFAYLGLYFRSGVSDIYPHRPCILICPENIATCGDGLEDHFRYGMVMIHEFAHAMMDPRNLRGVENADAIKDSDEDMERYKHECNYRHLEEKWANRIMLNYMKEYCVANNKADQFCKIVDSTKSQPAGYNQAADAPEDGWVQWPCEKCLKTH